MSEEIKSAEFFGTEEQEQRQIYFYRYVLLICALAYLLWWFIVKALLPNSFNPLGSRLFIVGTFLTFFSLSFYVDHIKRHLSYYFSAAIWLTTLHYFYLLYFNSHDINFVVGAYILVLVAHTCFPSEKSLLAYGIYIFSLSTGLVVISPELRSTVFLPGMITLLAFAYLALRDRLHLLTRSKEDARKMSALLKEVQKGEKNKILFEATKEALKIRDEFISIASHELKTPITTLKLQTQITRRTLAQSVNEKSTSEQALALVNQVERQVDRLSRLVEDMIEISRFSTGKFKIEKSQFELNQLAQEVILGMTQLSKESGSILEYSANNQEILITADRFRMEQVMINLITNALKYGQAKPVTLRVEKDPLEVRILVKDQGMGIAKEQQERIFERFERAVSSKHISGLGLGLFISQQIVEAHHGKIEVQSEVGKGALFVVRLPLGNS